MSSAQIVLVVLCILLMTALGSLGAVCFKKTSVGTEEFKIKKLLKNKWLYLGGILYVAGAVFNIIALRFLPYSVVLPFSSITYIWTIFFSYKYFKEKIGKFKIIAICCIVFGVILLIL